MNTHFITTNQHVEKSNRMYTSRITGMLLRSLFAIIPLMVITLLAQAQNAQVTANTTEYTVKGVVLSHEDNSALAGVNIYLKSKITEGTSTDAHGKFEFPRKLKDGEILVFSFVGLAKQEYVVTETTTYPLEIKMAVDTQTILGELWVDEDKPTKSRRKSLIHN